MCRKVMVFSIMSFPAWLAEDDLRQYAIKNASRTALQPTVLSLQSMFGLSTADWSIIRALYTLHDEGPGTGCWINTLLQDCASPPQLYLKKKPNKQKHFKPIWFEKPALKTSAKLDILKQFREVWTALFISMGLSFWSLTMTTYYCRIIQPRCWSHKPGSTPMPFWVPKILTPLLLSCQTTSSLLSTSTPNFSSAVLHCQYKRLQEDQKLKVHGQQKINWFTITTDMGYCTDGIYLHT